KVANHLTAMIKSDIHLFVTVGFENLQALIQHSELGADRYIYDATASLMAQVNAIVLYTELKKRGIRPKLLSGPNVQTSEISEIYTAELATRYAAQERIVLCNAPVDEGGFFDEDLSAVTRALDISAATLCKAVQPGALAHIGPVGPGLVLVKSEDLVMGTS